MSKELIIVLITAALWFAFKESDPYKLKKDKKKIKVKKPIEKRYKPSQYGTRLSKTVVNKEGELVRV